MIHTSKERAWGFTIVEMVISTVILLALSFLVTGMIISANSAQRFSIRLDRVAEISQEILYDMQDDVSAAVRMFGNDALGQAYRARIQPWPEAHRIASSTLPDIRPTSGFAKDLAGTEKTGNELLFARHAWSDTFTCASSKTYRVDVYRLVEFYLRPEGPGPAPAHPWGLNLCKWTSEPLVDGIQIDAIADADDRAEVLLHLHDSTLDDVGAVHDPIQVVWKLAQDPAAAGTFRQIMVDGLMSDTPQLPRAAVWEIERAVRRSSRGVVGYRHHSVASNYSQANQGVGRYGIRNDSAGTGVGFPHGFEIQIIGSGAARQVLIHLTIVSTARDGMYVYHDTQVILGVREG